MNERNHIVRFSYEETDSAADSLFRRANGLDREGERYETMKEEAYDVKGSIAGKVDIRALYSAFDSFTLQGDELRLEGARPVTFHCRAFERLQAETIRGVYVYLLAAGDYDPEADEDDVLTEYYADAWGTAFTDAGRFAFAEYLRQKNVRLSDSFGPGFYGMPTTELACFTELLDAELIGVSIGANGLLRPLKSCAGIFFDVTEEYRKLASACADCLGTALSCKLCSTAYL